MSERTDRWTLFGIAAILALLVGYFFVTGAYSERPAPPTGLHVTQFDVGQCIVKNGVREPWEPKADGVIISVGYAHYLWEPWTLYEENSKRYAWNRREYGISTEFKELEREYHVTTCPPIQRRGA